MVLVRFYPVYSKVDYGIWAIIYIFKPDFPQTSLNNQTHPKVATFTKEVTEGYSAALTCIVSDQDNDPNDQKWRTDEDTYIVGGNHPGV